MDNPKFMKIHNKNISKRAEMIQTLIHMTKYSYCAVIRDHEENYLTNIYRIPLPKTYECSASDNPIVVLKTMLDDGYLVLCNSASLKQFLEDFGQSGDYMSGTLFEREIPTSAGIPFLPERNSIGELFEKYLCSEEPDMEDILAKLDKKGIEILPPYKRKAFQHNPYGSLETDLRKFGLERYFKNLVDADMRNPEKTTTLEGEVIRIDSMQDDTEALIELKYKTNSRLTYIEVERLKANDLAFFGAHFFYIKKVMKDGRVILEIVPNKNANQDQVNRTKKKLNNFIRKHDEQHTRNNASNNDA